MFKAIPKEIRDQILSRIKNDGITANQAANDAGVSPKTVYGWLTKESKTSNCNLLELSRLKRENQALCEIVGELSLEIKRTKRGRS
jgi:transposase